MFSLLCKFHFYHYKCRCQLFFNLFQMYGQQLFEFVQGPGEVIFLPGGLTHSVLNLRDNVAYTENYLYVNSLPGMLTDFCSFPG